MKRLIKRLVGATADFASRVLFDPFYPSEQIDAQLAAELSAAFARMPPEQVQSDSRVESEWDRFRRQLRTQFSSSPRAFLRQAPVHGLLGMGNTRTSFVAWKVLRASAQWPRYRGVLQEDPVGKPIRFLFQPSSGGTQIHHTNHLCNFEEKTGTRVEQMRLIVEFGGGYGSFCRQAHRLGFSGKYLIFDLPELSALQAYFLRSVGLKLLPPDQAIDPAQAGISLVNSVSELRQLVEALKPAMGPSLFVATWSLSEVPREFREEILGIVGNLDHFLIAYQTAFGSVPNTEFFKEMISRRGGAGKWHHFPIAANVGSFYVIR